MRVLFWSGAFWPVIGGTEVRTAKLLPALQERGYEFVVVTSQTSPDLPREAKFQGIPVYRFPFWKSDENLDQLMIMRQQVAMLKRSFAPDLVHRNGISIGDFFDLTTVNAHPAPLLLTLCNDLQAKPIKQETLLNRMLRSADWVTSVSAAALAQARRLAPEITQCSSVIHTGLDTGAYTPTAMPTASQRLLYLGRLVFQKGVDLALTAFASILQRFPHIRLIIAGDGPERRALQQQAAQLGVMQAVDFLGWVPPEKVAALISTATVVVMPSRWEGLPTVALQAALMARPVVGTRVGGLPEVVVHGETGLLVEPEDSGNLTHQISFLLKHTQMAMLFGQAARRRAQQLFSWERCVEAYDILYQRLTKKVTHFSAS